MKAAIPRLRKKLGSDPEYFRRVYIYTFDFARSEGQRSVAIDIALAFWSLLLPHGLKGGALRPQDYGGDDPMKADGAWTEEHTQLWYDFLTEKNIKGISKDTWAMVRAFPPPLFFFFFSFSLSLWVVIHLGNMVQFLDFLRTIDAKFEIYDMEGTFPICAASAPLFSHSCHACSRMAVDDRRFCRVGTAAPKVTEFIGRYNTLELIVYDLPCVLAPSGGDCVINCNLLSRHVVL